MAQPGGFGLRRVEGLLVGDFDARVLDALGFAALDERVPEDFAVLDERVPDLAAPDERVLGVRDFAVPEEPAAPDERARVAVPPELVARALAARAAPVMRVRALASSSATRAASVSSWARSSRTSSTTCRSSSV
jgi:hypothetical protein